LTAPTEFLTHYTTADVELEIGYECDHETDSINTLTNLMSVLNLCSSFYYSYLLDIELFSHRWLPR